MDCHSTRRWDLYSGPMDINAQGAGGEIFNQDMGFPDRFFSPNITPYALDSWTDGEIFRAITSGVNKDGKALFPVMAYHRFGQMSAEDIHAIIAYIRTLPSIAKDNEASQADFPFNLILNTLPKKATLGEIPSKKDPILYGLYLVNAAGCVDCHSQVEKGKVIAGTEFGGGLEFKQPNGSAFAPNITFDKATGIGNWSETEFVNRFKMYADSNYQAPKLTPTDVNTPMPWTMYSGMTEDDLKAIYAYLKSLTPIQHQVSKFTTK